MRTIPEHQILSATREDYIRAIYTLYESSQPIRVTTIAKKLGLSKSTVSERLKELVQEKLVVADPYSEIVLTKKGIAVGAKLTFKHRTIEVFLNTVLKMPTHLVHAEAHKLEHAVSDDVIQRLSKFLNNPTEDPHGSTIPTITDWR